MRTLERTRTKSGAWRRIRAAALAIGALVVVARTARTTSGAAPDRPVSKCSEFGCEQ
jgi:hypothetical protein